MSIFKNESVAVSVPVDNRTLVEKQKQTSRRIVNMGQRHYNQLCRMQKEGIDAMWFNRDLTPQEVAEAVGKDGGVLIAAHGALTSAIIAAATAAGIAPDIKLPTNAFTVDKNGVVTVSSDPYVL
jgi:hypothetical protein